MKKSGALSIEDFNFSEYRNGADKRFTIKGKTLGVESKRLGSLFRIGPLKVLSIKDAELIFYKDNRPVSYVRAKRAVFDAPFDRADLTASLAPKVDFFGDITVITEDRRTMTCNNLRWDNSKESLFAKGNCVLRYEGKSVKADLIDSDVELQNFSFQNDGKKRLRGLLKMVSI